MRKGKKRNREQILFAVIFSALSALWLCLACAGIRADAAGETAAGGSHVLTLYDTRYNDGLLRVGYFEIDGGTTAMCVCHEMEPPMQTGTKLDTVAVYTAENRGNELLRKIYYYGWKGPEDVGASYVETCLAGSVANGHDDNYYGYGQAFIDRIAGKPAAPKGFQVFLLSDGVAADQNLAYWEYHPTGYAKLKKAKIQTQLTDQNTCYSIQGAEYGVYKEEDCKEQVAVLTTDAEGNTKPAELEPGSYYIREKKAPSGYRLDEKIYPVTVKAQETTVAEVKDVPVWNDLSLYLEKQDADRAESAALGEASLEGAAFQVCFYAGYYTEDTLPEKPDRTWVFETVSEEADGGTRCGFRFDQAHLAEGDAFYQADGKTVLPLGTVTVQEIRAPKGYLSEGVSFRDDSGEVRTGRYLTQIVQEGNTAGIRGGNQWTASDRVIRGDLKLVKIADGTQKRLAGIPFRITSKTTGESHTIVTDENGQASTAAQWNLHTADTNRGETSADGVWFGQKSDGTLTEPDDSRGALPYDTYTVEELACQGNQGYERIPAFEVTIRKDLVTVDLGTLTDDKPEEPEEPEEPAQPENPETPEKETEAKQQAKAAPVRTGDEGTAGIWLAAAILSCVAILICVMITRITKKR